MIESTLIMIAIAFGMWVYARSRGDDSAQRGVIAGWKILKDTLPLLILAFAIVGYVKVLAPQDLVRSWIGPDSGLRGVVIGTAAGTLLPGGPYVVFPLVAALYQSGAGLGPTLAMITSWSALALLTISFELPFMGWRFSVLRLSLGLFAPILVGIIGWLAFTG
jgi:uncharacterized membrane protein YraQ (UPF0718 family)